MRFALRFYSLCASVSLRVLESISPSKQSRCSFVHLIVELLMLRSWAVGFPPDCARIWARMPNACHVLARRNQTDSQPALLAAFVGDCRWHRDCLRHAERGGSTR